MRRALDRRLARLGQRRAAEAAAIEAHHAVLVARVAVGRVLRDELSRRGVDPARLPMLRVCDAAAAELAAEPPAVESAVGTEPAAPVAGTRHEAAAAADFAARLTQLAERCRRDVAFDPARASLAEALAWCLVEGAGAPLPSAAAGGIGDFAADSLQEQRQDGGR